MCTVKQMMLMVKMHTAFILVRRELYPWSMDGVIHMSWWMWSQTGVAESFGYLLTQVTCHQRSPHGSYWMCLWRSTLLWRRMWHRFCMQCLSSPNLPSACFSSAGHPCIVWFCLICSPWQLACLLDAALFSFPSLLRSFTMCLVKRQEKKKALSGRTRVRWS